MHCPSCSYAHSKVTDSRLADNGIRRRRECQACEIRFTTYERVLATPLMITKQDGRREEFSREKLITGIRKACAKRPVASRTIERLVEDVENQLHQKGSTDVPTSMLGTLVMDRLRALDRVAYIRYSSVYRDFQDIESFEKAVRDLREGNPQLTLPDMPPATPRNPRRRNTSQQAKLRANGSLQYADDEQLDIG